MFTDKVQGVFFKSGSGGRGCVSFRREKYIPYGGPNGGDGGKGGDIILKGSKHSNTLVDFKFKKHFRAECGEHGKGSDRDGKNGRDLIVEVPLGTEIIFEEKVLCEILTEDSFIFLKGGKGGIGNKKLCTSTNRAPMHTILPETGREIVVDMKLKLIGDVGIVGAPNSGKSSFINSITNANSKVGDYKFTTIHPHLGAYKKVVFVDIPGLIEGASKGKGLGFEFLSHVERCTYLLLMVDVADDPINIIDVIKKEVREYNIEKTMKICFNKCDLLEKSVLDSIKLSFPEAFFISAKEKYKVEEVGEYFYRLIYNQWWLI